MAAFANMVDCCDQMLCGTTPEDIAIASGADGVVDDCVVLRARHDDNLGACRFGADASNQLGAVKFGKVEVEYDDFGTEAADIGECRLAVDGGSNDLEVGLLSQDSCKPLPTHLICIGDEDCGHLCTRSPHLCTPIVNVMVPYQANLSGVESLIGYHWRVTVIPRLRSLVLPILAFLAVAPCFADDLEEAWKNMVMQALYAAGSNDFARAEQLLLKALHEAERFGPSDPRVGRTLNSVGLVYRSEKKYAPATASFQKSLTILEVAYGPESLDVANINYNIGSTLLDDSKFAQSLPYLQKSIDMYSRLLGGQSLKTASAICGVGEAHRGMKAWAEAEKSLKRCGEIREADGGVVNKEFGDAMASLAYVYHQSGKTAQADSTYKLAEGIREKTYGIMSSELANTLEAHAGLLKQLGRDRDAEKNMSLVNAIRRKK